MMEIDFSLIQRARAGDEGAWEFIVARMLPLVRLKAKSFFLSGGSQDDLLQEGLIGLWKAVKDYRPDRGASFRSFVSLCVTRQLISAVIQARRDKHKILNEAVSLENNPFSDGEGEGRLSDLLSDSEVREPLNQVMDSERTENLVDGLLGLLSRHEAAVLQLFLEDMSYEQIAASLGCEAKSVDNAVQRVRRKFNLLTGAD